MYKAQDKMCDLMAHEEEAIQIISRFGLNVGVGDKSIGLSISSYTASVRYRQRLIWILCSDIYTMPIPIFWSFVFRGFAWH